MNTFFWVPVQCVSAITVLASLLAYNYHEMYTDGLSDMIDRVMPPPFFMLPGQRQGYFLSPICLISVRSIPTWRDILLL